MKHILHEQTAEPETQAATHDTGKHKTHAEPVLHKQSAEPETQAATHHTRIHKSHPEQDDLLELVKQPLHELEKHARIANERIRELLNGLSKEDMIDRIHQLQLSDKSLNFLSEGIALEKDDYDICVAMEEYKRRLPENLTDDPVDHMNYTAL